MPPTTLTRATLPRATTTSLHHPFSTTPTTQDPTVTTAVSILTHQRSKTRWSTLLSLFPHGFTPQQTSQITLQIRNNPILAHNFFSFSTLHSLSSPPTLLSYTTIIHILARARLPSRVKALIKKAFWASGSLGFGPNSDLHEKSLSLFKMLLETYKACDSTPLVFDYFIKSLLEMNGLDACVDIVRLLRSRGFCPHVSSCNLMVLTALRVKGCDFGYDLYRELFGFSDNDDSVSNSKDDDGKVGGVGYKVRPNVSTFNELMLGFYRYGTVEMVEEMWIEMARRKCKPNVVSYSVLMAAYCEEGEVEKARIVWEDMKGSGLEADVVLYNTLIGGCCKVGEVEKGEELFREMELSGLEGTSVTYQHLVNGYCLVGDVDSALLLCKDVSRKGFSLDSSCVDSMVRLLCDRGMVSEALELFRKVTGNDDFVAKGSSYEVLIKGFCGEGEMEEALKLQAKMVGKGFRPNSDIYGAFIDGYTRQGKLELAESLRKEMVASLT